MGKNERLAYLISIKERYYRSNKKQKAIILDEFCKVCNYNRKYAVRILNKSKDKPKKKIGPKHIYKPDELLEPLKCIWETANKPCSQKLKEILSSWIGHYEAFYEPLEINTKKLLLKISRSTIERLLAKEKSKNKRKGLSGTTPGTLLKNQIPIHDNIWDEGIPGFLEADTVALCGDTLVQGFIWCVTLTDIHTTWTEIRGNWNKQSEGILDKIKDVEDSLPFKIKGFDCDNGSEFLNHNLMEYLQKREDPVQFTRSRPYRKNDNAHVEQKNWTHVRQLFGYDRFNKAELVPLVNDLLANEWSQYKNHFLPSMKLIKKVRVNSKYKKVYDKPQTPYQRLINSPTVDKMTKLKLIGKHEALNPFVLKAEIDRKLKEIMRVLGLP